MEVPVGEREIRQVQQDGEQFHQFHSWVAQKLNIEYERIMANPCTSLLLVGVKCAVRSSFS